MITCNIVSPSESELGFLSQINLNLLLTFHFTNLIFCYAYLTSVPHCKMDNCSCLDIVAKVKTRKIVDMITRVPNKNSIVCLLFQMNTNFC